jgi:hypothetical protein
MLLRSAISYPNRRALAEYVNSQKSTPSWDVFLITMPKLRRKYWQTLIALHRELVPNHTSSEDLYLKLWQLFKEVAVNANMYQTGRSLDQKLLEFCQGVKKPLQIFDIIYEIKNFDVGKATFNLGTVEIFKLTEDYLQKLGLKKGVSQIQDKIFEEWSGRSVAKTEVNVSDINRAYESGIPIVNKVLNTIRLAAIREWISRPDDEMFLWEVGGSISIPRVKPRSGPILSRSYHRGFRPLVVPMDQTIAKGLRGQKSWQYILDGNLPKDINIRVDRAIEWISHAVTSTSLDYKLVDLCTALEILLLPDHKFGTKGELIALRQVLVGRGTSYEPGFILSLYEKRSKIIHSGTLEITSFSDYWNLKICCLQVLSNISSLSKQHPNIQRLRDLLKVVENAGTLQAFVERCDCGFYGSAGINKIKEAAENQLAKTLRGQRRGDNH